MSSVSKPTAPASVTRIHPERAAPAAAKRKRKQPKKKPGGAERINKGGSPHPGVMFPAALQPRYDASGQHVEGSPRWHVASVRGDPDDIRGDYKKTLHDMTRTQAYDWAVSTSARIRRQRLANVAAGARSAPIKLRLWSDDPHVPNAVTVFVTYYALQKTIHKRPDGTEFAQPRSAPSVQKTRVELVRFAQWLIDRGVEWCHEVMPVHLTMWRDERFTAFCLNKQKRQETSTINLARKNVRYFVEKMIADGYMPQLRAELPVLRSHILKLEKEAKGTPRFLFTGQWLQLLSAALRFDRRTRKAVGPAVLLGRMTGLRREEAALLQVRHIVFGGEWGAVIELPAEAGKNSIARAIKASPYSPLLVELLRALVAGRGPDEYITRPDSGLERAVKSLRLHGAPPFFHWHMLRTTSICYAYPMLVSSPEMSEQYGNGSEVREQYYAAAKGRLPIRAESIDACIAAACEMERPGSSAELQRAAKRKPAKRVELRHAARTGRQSRPQNSRKKKR